MSKVVADCTCSSSRDTADRRETSAEDCEDRRPWNRRSRLPCCEKLVLLVPSLSNKTRDIHGVLTSHILWLSQWNEKQVDSTHDGSLAGLPCYRATLEASFKADVTIGSPPSILDTLLYGIIAITTIATPPLCQLSKYIVVYYVVSLVSHILLRKLGACQVPESQNATGGLGYRLR